MRLFDTHAHLDDEKFNDDQDAVIKRAKDADLSYILSCGACVETSRAAQQIAKKNDMVYCAAGVHPHDAKDFDAGQLRQIEELMAYEKCMALGEIGLDYHYDFSPRDRQIKCFQDQLRLAEKLDAPVIFHIRKAWEDFLAMLRGNELPKHAVMHCFSGSMEVAEECLDYGMMLSFTGVVTFNNAKKTQRVAQSIPLERMMVETDCPYMAPVPHRGKRNEPAYVRDVAAYIANLRGIALDQLADQTTENALTFFRIGE